MKQMLWVVFVSLFSAWAAVPSLGDTFEKQIVPLLVNRCLGCHGKSDPQGEFVLSNRVGAFAGGESKKPAIVPGNPAESHLLIKVKEG